VAARVDAACDRFEADWRAGRRPRPEDHLGAAAGPERPVLLRELLAVELAYRRREGEAPGRDEYQRRFPDDAELIGHLFATTWGASPDPGTVPGGGDPTADHLGRPAGTPERVGKYLVVRPLGRGGQATALLAFDPDLQRHVVLKRYHVGDGSRAERALGEGRALARVDSPYVARCLGAERRGGEVLLVVEHVAGRDLGRAHRERPLDFAEAAAVVAQAAEGLAAVHACGLLHRDLKPANILLGDDGRPRLVDFGLATHLGGDRLGECSGTPSYMAPEQARGEPERIDFRTDVFGLGAVLYELLAGRPLYREATTAEALDRASAGDFPPPSRLNPSVPAPLEAVCLKALAKAPAHRYASATEFAAALRQATTPAPRPRPAWVRRGLAAAIALGLLLLLTAAVWLWPGGEGTVGPVPTAGTSAGDPLRADIVVSHFRDRGPGQAPVPVGMVSEDSLAGDPPRLRDLVRVRVALSRPAFGYLIALNPNGRVQHCLTLGPRAAGPPGRGVEFPEDPKDYFSLTDGVGLLAFVVVASDRPLPDFQAWKARVPGGLAWSPAHADGLWTYDANPRAGDPARLRGRLRGEVIRRQAAPASLDALCGRLRRAPGVTLVQALAFPVKPDRETLK
jgi:hypothetical protein